MRIIDQAGYSTTPAEGAVRSANIEIMVVNTAETSNKRHAKNMDIKEQNV